MVENGAHDPTARGQDPVELIVLCSPMISWAEGCLILFASAHGDEYTFDELTNQEWNFMEQAIAILKPAYEATTEISGELYVTRSYIIPLTQSLVNYY